MFSGVTAPLTWVFTAYLILCLFSLNHTVLVDNSKSASKTLLYSNRRLLAVLCVLVLLFANIKAVGTAIRAVITWIVTAVAQVMAWFASLMQTETGAGPADVNGMMQGLAEESEPSLFSRIMEIVLIVLVVAIAAVLLWFVVKHLIRLLKRAFRAILERLNAYRKRIAADFDDQSESLLDWSEIKRTTKGRINRLKRRYLPTPWERLSPAERVRRVYTLLLRRQKEPNPALTARETLAGGAFKLHPQDASTLAALYDRARYSSHPITPADADDLRRRAGV